MTLLLQLAQSYTDPDSHGYKLAWQKANLSTGELFRGETFTWTFPKPFSEEPFFAGSASGSNWIVDNGGYNRNNTENVRLQTRRSIKSTGDPIVRLAAIGFWKEPDL